ncbi:Replicative DNA helicase [Candidatus Brocadiaceae bacterium]|nr:Replicative DNA helicase [Candidatus Brocadiaceae bacterium]
MSKKKTTYAQLLDLPEGLKMPSASDIERAVLGAMLIDNTSVDVALHLLNDQSFYVPAHAHIFRAMQAVEAASQPIDFITVRNELQRMGTENEAGGAAYLMELTQDVSTAANIEAHCRIVLEKEMLRRLIRVSHQIATRAYAAIDDPFDILDQSESEILQVTQDHMKQNFVEMPAAVKEALRQIDLIHAQDYKKLAVPTGYFDLDEILGGFQPSDLIILAARPSMGKTAMALCLARNAAIQYQVPVAFFSLEMSSTQLVMRLICAEGNLDSNLVRTGKLPQNQAVNLSKAGAKLTHAPIYIDDSSELTALEIRAKCRRLHREKNIGIIFIDYLQLMHGSGKQDNREREVAIISRSLKALAKELKIPVVALAQLNRQVEDQNMKRPQLSNLRESGSLEQDADVVLFLHRPEYYGIQQYEDGTSTRNIAEVLIAKHRNGPVGDVRLRFLREYAKFESLDLVRDIDEMNVRAPREDYI